MSGSSQVRIKEICDVFTRLSERVAASPCSRLDPYVSLSMRRATEELRRFIPGLYASPEDQVSGLGPPPDEEGARFLARSAYGALEDGNASEALSRALRGLSFAPHHPGLWYLAANCCFEYGAVEDAIRLLRHVLWINPGHRAARRDLLSLNLYLKDRWEGPGEMELPPSIRPEDREERVDDDHDFE